MNYAIITDHVENRISFGLLEAARHIPHSTKSSIDFLQTKFQLNYAVGLISLSYPKYQINNFLIKKSS